MNRRIVGTLTTLPDREDKLIRTLRSLHAQTVKLDAIYLAVPKEARRLKMKYPEFSDQVKKLATIVDSPDDFGPLTKLYGGLSQEKDPNTIIISFDDDVNYPVNSVEILLKYHSIRDNAAIASCGFYIKHGFPFIGATYNIKSFWSNIFNIKVPEDGRKCDILCGVVGVLYLRKFFPSDKEELLKFFQLAHSDNNLYLNDDVLISGYLSQKNIDRYVFSNLQEIVADKYQGHEVDISTGNELSADKIKFIQKFNAAIYKAKEIGMFNQPEEISYNETIAGQVLFGLFVLLILVLIVVIIYINRRKLSTKFGTP